MNLPHLDRLAHGDPDTLTARQLQVLLVRREAETATGSASERAMRTTRLGAEVPALLAHIDELYGRLAREDTDSALVTDRLVELVMEVGGPVPEDRADSLDMIGHYLRCGLWLVAEARHQRDTLRARLRAEVTRLADANHTLERERDEACAALAASRRAGERMRQQRDEALDESDGLREDAARYLAVLRELHAQLDRLDESGEAYDTATIRATLTLNGIDPAAEETS